MMSGHPMNADRRERQRRRCLLQVRLVYNDTQCSLSGRIRDISSHGAYLVVGNNLHLPELFYIVIHDAEGRIPARLIWRSADSIGVQFTLAQDQQAVMAPLTVAQTIH
jgi:hypothetical protein